MCCKAFTTEQGPKAKKSAGQHVSRHMQQHVGAKEAINPPNEVPNMTPDGEASGAQNTSNADET